MLIYPQTVPVYWRNNTRAWYESRGYEWTKQGESFEVDIKDLYEGSTQTVLFSCDNLNCNEIFPIQWRYYKQRKNPRAIQRKIDKYFKTGELFDNRFYFVD